MYGLILLAIILAAVAFAFLAGKGLRTTILGYATAMIGAALPLLSEVIAFLQTLDWRTYLLSEDPRNKWVLVIIAVLGIGAVIMRYKTTGPVGTDK